MFHTFNQDREYKRKICLQNPIQKLDNRKEIVETFFRTVNKTLELAFIKPVFHHGAYRLVIFLNPYNFYPGIPIGCIENDRVFLDCNLIYKLVQITTERRKHFLPLESKHKYFQALFYNGAIKTH